MCIGPGSEKTSNFEKYPCDIKGKWDELANQGMDVYLVQKHPILKGCINIRKGELKRGASDPSVKMMMDFTSPASDFWIVFGICVCSGKTNEIDLENRRNTASAVVTPRVSENVAQSRPYAAEQHSSGAPREEENLCARASSFKNTWPADSERSTAEGNLLLLPYQQQEKQLSKERKKNRRTTLFDFVKLQITQKS